MQLLFLSKLFQFRDGPAKGLRFGSSPEISARPVASLWSYSWVQDPAEDVGSEGRATPFWFSKYELGPCWSALQFPAVFQGKEINKNPNLLYNMTLGFDIYNVDFGGWSTLKNPFIWLSGQSKIPNYTCMRESNSVAALTGISGITSAQIGTLLGLYRLPQLTFGNLDPVLSEQNKFHPFYQIASKDTSLANAMVSLMLHFHWNWNCPEDASLEWLPGHIFDMTMSEVSYNIYNAVYAVAHALHKMILHQTEKPLMGNMKGRLPSSAQLHPFLKKIQFHNPVGEQVILDEKDKLEAEYDIVNQWNFPEGLELKVKVGLFSPYAPHGHQLSLSEEMIEWAIGTAETPHSVCSESCGAGFRKSPQEEKAACCFDCALCPENEISNETDMEQCVKCADHLYASTKKNQCLLRDESFLAHGDPLGMALACMALCLSTLTAAVLGLFVKYQDTAIVKANNRTLSYILLTSLIFCFLCALLFIGRPNTATCILQQITFGVVFTVAVSTVLAKTVTVVLAFKATCPGRRMRWLLVSGAPNLLIPTCTLIQVSLCGLWLGSSPPFVDTDAHSEHGHLIILCNKGSLTAFYCVLGYLGSLALASFTVAFLARNLPDTFNEAKFLTFSMLVFCSVWLTFLPVYHSARGKVMVAVEVFSILASGAGLLGCIFAPKCYIILFMPNRNFLHGFKDKRQR
ncbi:vomeronasal type-2 receptor 116-like [Thomomys bottae]